MSILISFLFLALILTGCATMEGSAGLAPCQTIMGGYDQECLTKKDEKQKYIDKKTLQFLEDEIKKYPEALKGQLSYMKYAEQKEIVVGMYVIYLIALKGKPIRENTTRTKYNTYEQWVYKDFYYHMENGFITSITNNPFYK